MKILLTSRFCQVGGAETFMLSLGTALQALGHDCEMFFFEHGPFERHIPPNWIVHVGGLADCMRVVKERQIDVVHARTFDWPAGISVVRRLGAKLVVTGHGSVVLGWHSGNCDAIVGCAQWLADEQQAVTDVPVTAILNGIDTSKFAPAPAEAPASPPIVAWVGRGIDARKRLDAFAALAEYLARAGVRLWVIDPHGPKEVGQVFPDVSRKLIDLAEFWGAVPTADMPSMYQQVAASGGCIVSTATWEGLPLTLIEAQACGCPAVASDVRGSNECVLPAHGGVLYPSSVAAETLAASILDMLGNRDEMKRRGAACAAYMRRQFSLERMAREYLRVYHDAPYRREGGYLASMRARRGLSPLRNWDGYLAQRWSVGQQQYAASQEFVRTGEWNLAKAAARDCFLMSPTMFIRPRRVGLLIRTHLHAG